MLTAAASRYIAAFTFLLIPAVLTAALPAHAQNSATIPLPSGGTPLLPADALGAFSIGGATDSAQVERVAVTGQPFTEALRVRTTKKTPLVYGVQLSAPPSAPVKAGDIVLATFYLRSIAGQAETGEARTQFVFERNSAPHTKSVTQDIEIPARAWKRFDIPFKIAEDGTAEETRIHFRLGYNPQAFEIGGVSLTNFGDKVMMRDLPRTAATYAGMEPNAAWRKEAEARIEKIRKGDLTVKVVGRDGRPVRDAQVTVRMTRHTFPFGSAVAAEMLLGEGPDADKYREMVPRLFNRVVMENDLKWPNWEENRERALKGVSWLRSNGVQVRGHNLVWPSWRYSPRDLPTLKDDKAALAKRVRDHIVDEVTATRGTLVEWDVVNEPFDNHDILDVLGRDALIEWFRLARATDAAPRLFLNDYPPLDGADTGNAHLEHFYATIKYLKDNGAPIQGIGFQGHFGGGVIPPTRLLSGLDRFSAFGLPIAITEFDINTTDENLQAAYMRDFMTAVFSHPSVNGIIMWGFWEGRHWLPDAALWNRDWSIRPHGQVWMDLVHKAWWTNADGKTDRRGEFKTRGFLGDYEITARTADGKTATRKAPLRQEGAQVVVTVE